MYHENKKNSSIRKIQPVGSEPSNLGTSILMERNKGELSELLGKASPEGDSGWGCSDVLAKLPGEPCI